MREREYCYEASSPGSQSNQSVGNKGPVPLCWPGLKMGSPVSNAFDYEQSKGKYTSFFHSHSFFRPGSAELILARVWSKRLSLIYQTQCSTLGPQRKEKCRAPSLTYVLFLTECQTLLRRRGTSSIHHRSLTPYHMTACHKRAVCGWKHLWRPAVWWVGLEEGCPNPFCTEPECVPRTGRTWVRAKQMGCFLRRGFTSICPEQSMRFTSD